MAWCSVQA